jgi:hypothetical protein
MGRPSDPLTEFVGEIHLERVPLTDGGDYDEGGAYWGGGGGNLYCAWDDEGHEHYLRARNLKDAKAKLPATAAFGRDHRDTIVRGMASMLWALAWADHTDEHRCARLSGMDIMDVMPTVPPEAVKQAEKLIAGIEKANNAPLEVIFLVACKADGAEADPEEFGGDLAHMAIGSGISWFDDHEKFPLKMPYGSNDELRMYADDNCQEA